MDRSVEACRRWRDTKVRSEGGEYGPARGRKLAESDVAERAHENLPYWALRRARASTPQSICFCGEEQKKQILVAAATARNDRGGTFIPYGWAEGPCDISQNENGRMAYRLSGLQHRKVDSKMLPLA